MVTKPSPFLLPEPVVEENIVVVRILCASCVCFQRTLHNAGGGTFSLVRVTALNVVVITLECLLQYSTSGKWEQNTLVLFPFCTVHLLQSHKAYHFSLHLYF